MAIAAQRIKYLDKQTNVPVFDFLTSDSSDILNIPTIDIAAATAQLTAMVDGNQIGNVTGMLRNIAQANQLGVARLTKDFYSSITDISHLASDQIKAISNRMFPGDPTLQATFNKIGEGCKAKILSGLSNCRNKKNTARYNGKKTHTNNRSCSADSFVALINKLTNGLYNAALIDQCALSKMVAGVAIRGFEIGLPSVFSALSGRIEDTHLLAQTGSIVLGAVAAEGNINAVMDVANSRVGGMVRSINPGITQSILQNFRTPVEYIERDRSELYDQFKGSMMILDSSWDSTVTNGTVIPSVENMTGDSSELMDLYSCKAATFNPVMPVDGTVPDVAVEEYMVTALKFARQSASSSIGSDLGYVPLTMSSASESIASSFSELW